MTGFNKNPFWIKMLSMYPRAMENDFVIRLNADEVEELKSLFLEVYVPLEKLQFYDDQRIMKEMMRAIVSIYRLDKDIIVNYGELVSLIYSVRYDGKNMNLYYSKISLLRLRRLELGKTRKQIAERMGYGASTVRNCENYWCDMSRQPENLRIKFAKALECSIEEFNEMCGISE